MLTDACSARDSRAISESVEAFPSLGNLGSDVKLIGFGLTDNLFFSKNRSLDSLFSFDR